MHERSLCTGHTDVSDDDEATSVWVTTLNCEGVEDGNDGTSPMIEQTETPTAAESKAKIDKVVQVISKWKKWSMVARQIACMNEKMGAKEV